MRILGLRISGRPHVMIGSLFSSGVGSGFANWRGQAVSTLVKSTGSISQDCYVVDLYTNLQ